MLSQVVRWELSRFSLGQKGQRNIPYPGRTSADIESVMVSILNPEAVKRHTVKVAENTDWRECVGHNEDLATSMWFLQTEAQIKCVGIVTNGN